MKYYVMWTRHGYSRLCTDNVDDGIALEFSTFEEAKKHALEQANGRFDSTYTVLRPCYGVVVKGVPSIKEHTYES